jgi:PGF-pre-PGF domain-containing protein
MVPSNTTAQGDYHLNVTATVGKAAYSKDVAIRLYEPSWLTRQFTEHLGRTLLIAIAAIVVLFIIIAIIVRIYGHFTSEEHAQKKADKKRLRAEREAERQKLRQAQEKEAERKRREAEAARKKEETRIQKEIEHRKREDEKRQSDEYFARATAAAERELRKKNVLVARRTLEGRETSYRWVWFLVLLLLVAAVAVVAWLYPWIWQTYPLYVAIGVGIAIILILVLILEEYARGKRQRVFRFKALNKGKRTLATSWNTGVNELTLAVKQVLAKCRLCIRRGRKPSAFMAYEGMAYDYFTIEGKDIEDKDVDGIKVRFAVKKSWLRRNNINPDKVRLAHFTDAWRTTTAEVIGEDKKKVYYSADASFGNYAIVAKVAGKARKSAAWSWVLSIFILLILIGGSYALTFFATPQVVPAIVPGTKGIAPQYWPMNTDHTLALSTWFVDPDNDTLAYTYTPVQDIIVTVTNSVATFSPNKDFLGERTIQFTASDGKGGKVKSNEVRLVVYQPPTPTPLGMIGTFCTQYLLYIAIVAVVLVVIILGFEYRAPLKKFLDED